MYYLPNQRDTLLFVFFFSLWCTSCKKTFIKYMLMFSPFIPSHIGLLLSPNIYLNILPKFEMPKK